MPETYNHPILLYYSIGQPGYDPERLSVDPEDFFRHMEYLYDAGYEVLALKDLIHMKPSKQKRTAITFDGGYKDILITAKEILDEFKFPASLFVPSYCVFNDYKPQHYSSEWGYLSEDELVIAQLNYDIYPHGASSSALTHLKKHELTQELTDAKKQISDFTGQPCPFMALPYGQGSEEIEMNLEQNGYTHAFGKHPKLEKGETLNPYNLNRIPIYGEDAFPTFVSKIKGMPAWVTRVLKNTFSNNP